MKQIIIKVASYVILIAIIVLLTVILKQQHEELLRLENNQDALLDTVQVYKAKNGQSVLSVRELQLKKRELEGYCSDLTDQLHNLGIKLRKAEAISQAGTETQIEIRTVIRDSIVYVDQIPENHKVVSWSDPWTDLCGSLDGDTLTAKFNSRDTLTAVVHRKKKCIFKKAEYWMDITSSNPHSTIVYEKYVKVVK